MKAYLSISTITLKTLLSWLDYKILLQLTPLELNVKDHKDDDNLLRDPTVYKKLIGNLVYLTITKLDISHAINIVSQSVIEPQHLHLADIKRIIRYLLRAFKSGIFFPIGSSLKVTTYCDVDWVGCPNTHIVLRVDCASIFVMPLFHGNIKSKIGFLNHPPS